jgi:outer membrane lipoprotein carrier protein
MLPERPTLRFALAVAAFASAWYVTAVSASGDEALDTYIRQVESSYRSVKSWKADFLQVYRSGDRERRESGTVILARGGKMRWDYRQPEAKLFLADGKVTELYVPSEKQLQRFPEKNSEDYRAPFALLLTRVNLHRVFGKIEDAGPGVNAGDRVLGCFPKREDEGYEEVRVELTPALDVRRLMIQYPDHSVMQFTFERIERNVATPAALFTLLPPAGTEVIDQPNGTGP